MECTPVADWTVCGKTGTAYPRQNDGSFDYARGWGWFVGWADNAGNDVVFVRLTQARERSKGSPGNTARDAFLAEWPALIADFGR